MSWCVWESKDIGDVLRDTVDTEGEALELAKIYNDAEDARFLKMVKKIPHLTRACMNTAYVRRARSRG